MRLVSVLALAAVVLGIGYVVIFKQEWIFKGKMLVSGYTPADSPQKALDLFAKAIKDRDYQTAAQYVDGDYAAELERAHATARPLAQTLDQMTEWIKNKAFWTKKTSILLWSLDPFPKNFTPGQISKQEGDKAWGEYNSEPVTEFDPNMPVKNLDAKMFSNVLGFVCSNPKEHPFNHASAVLNNNLQKVELVKVGDGDSKSWKIKLNCNSTQKSNIGHFIDSQPRYMIKLEGFVQRMNNTRYTDRFEFENELFGDLTLAK